MRIYKFIPSLQKVGQMSIYPDSIIKREPMLFSADKNFAMQNGGVMTTEFVQNHLSDYDDWIIDSRVHMLMPGWYPCIPGWHHDDVPRKGERNQPDYDTTEYFSEHKMCVIGADAMPEFINRTVVLGKPDGVVYEEWNRYLRKHLIPQDITRCESGSVYSFKWHDFHRGTQSNSDCWRFFIRASRNTKRKFYNEIRTQVQVYMSALEAGW